jgi:hypothetical protein
MTDNSDAPDTNTTTGIFDGNQVVPLPGLASRSGAALRSLMRDWGQEGVVDEDESETELMVLLCGIVSVSDPTLKDA